MHDELTKKDIEKMEAEIEHRKLVVRKEALEDVKEARAQGDLSENFEYKAAKKFKNENESRIRLSGTTPFDMRVQNKIDRFKGAHLIQKMNDKLIEHKQYIAEYGQDLEEIRNWEWHK